MNVGVTGGGFVGSQVCQTLVQTGHTVVCVDNLYLPCDHLFPLLQYDTFSFHKLDIRDTDTLRKVFEKCHGIIHTAGIVGAPKVEKDKEYSYDVNVNGTKSVAEVCGDRPLVNCSSGSVYGVIEDLCTEDSPLNPTSEYGIQKKVAEDIVSEMAKSVSFRFSTGCGVSLKFRKSLLPNTFVYEALVNKKIDLAQPENYRTFISVIDMANCLTESIFILYMEQLNNTQFFKHKVYNVGDENLNMTKDTLAKMIQHVTGCELTYKHNYIDPDSRNYQVSFDRIHELGWQVKYPMLEIIHDLVKAIPMLDEREYE